ncbi:NAD-dependent epimerase/dehydratase family protein [Fretibacter rubidus]|uniref:NAD-dependent epimerase/dehydratase family protein n=1 Tax=Fretibacter rubidus TaxID=570162 RepID=UPI00352B22E3
MAALRKDSKIVITGIAGLVGQNLSLRLHAAGYSNIHGIDKHTKNLSILRETQPWVKTMDADLAEPGSWANMLKDADIVVLNQAQIGGLDYTDFERNNITATQNILAAVNPKAAPFIIHISSSVVNSSADDFYTRSKTEQERIVVNSSLPHCVLRPTLMFGWFDRKHLGWLRRFMTKTPVFPIPGNGKYIRQPLYAGDFCEVIIACMQSQPKGEIFDISGQDKHSYIDLIKTIKRVCGLRTWVIKIPYSLFYALLWLAAKVMKNPPFTTAQLKALIIPEEFPVTDWPTRFTVTPTPFEAAAREAYTDPRYAGITLDF